MRFDVNSYYGRPRPRRRRRRAIRRRGIWAWRVSAPTRGHRKLKVKR